MRHTFSKPFLWLYSSFNWMFICFSFSNAHKHTHTHIYRTRPFLLPLVKCYMECEIILTLSQCHTVQLKLYLRRHFKCFSCFHLNVWVFFPLALSLSRHRYHQRLLSDFIRVPSFIHHQPKISFAKINPVNRRKSSPTFLTLGAQMEMEWKLICELSSRPVSFCVKVIISVARFIFSLYLPILFWIWPLNSNVLLSLGCLYLIMSWNLMHKHTHSS